MKSHAEARRATRFLDTCRGTLAQLCPDPAPDPRWATLVHHLVDTLRARYDGALPLGAIDWPADPVDRVLDAFDHLEQMGARLAREARDGPTEQTLDALVARMRSDYICWLRAERRQRRAMQGDPLRSEGDLGDRNLTPAEALSVSAVENIGSGVMVIDTAGQVVFANGFAEQLLGQRAVGNRLSCILPRLEMEDGESQRRVTIDLPTGESILLGYRCVPCTIDGTPATVMTFRDVTEMERMRAEMNQVKRLSELGQMCAMVAHEIRNPLAGIKATVQSIDEEVVDEDLRQPLQLIHREVDRLAELLTGFFAFVRQKPPRLRPTRLSELLGRVRASAGPRLDSIRVEERIGVTSPVLVDPDQLQQVLLNLLLNAADAANGDGRVVIEATLEDAELRIAVRDNGCGLPSEAAARLFEPFFSTKTHGTGLGLCISKRIIESHGGRIRIGPAPGRGTTVTLSLPAKPHERDWPCDARRS